MSSSTRCAAFTARTSSCNRPTPSLYARIWRANGVSDRAAKVPSVLPVAAAFVPASCVAARSSSAVCFAPIPWARSSAVVPGGSRDGCGTVVPLARKQGRISCQTPRGNRTTWRKPRRFARHSALPAGRQPGRAGHCGRRVRGARSAAQRRDAHGRHRPDGSDVQARTLLGQRARRAIGHRLPRRRWHERAPAFAEPLDRAMRCALPRRSREAARPASRAMQTPPGHRRSWPNDEVPRSAAPMTATAPPPTPLLLL